MGMEQMVHLPNIDSIADIRQGKRSLAAHYYHLESSHFQTTLLFREIIFSFKSCH